MQTFSLTTKLNNNSYTNLSLKTSLNILSDYFAQFGDNSNFEFTCDQTEELILLDTIFTTKNSKNTLSQLLELLPYYSQISPIIL